MTTPSDNEADDRGGRGGCLWLVLLVVGVGLAAWLLGAAGMALDRALTEDALDALVPFRGGHFGWGEVILSRQGSTLAARLVVGAMVWVVLGLFVTLPFGALARSISQTAGDRVVRFMVVLIALGAFVYTPVSSLFHPLYPVVVDPARQVFELRERTFLGPLNSPGSTVERTIPFASVRRFGHRSTSEDFRGGHYLYAELHALVEEGGARKWVLLGVAQVEGGEFDLASCVRSAESKEAEAHDLGLAAARALTDLLKLETPPLSVEGSAK